MVSLSSPAKPTAAASVHGHSSPTYIASRKGVDVGNVAGELEVNPHQMLLPMVVTFTLLYILQLLQLLIQILYILLLVQLLLLVLLLRMLLPRG